MASDKSKLLTIGIPTYNRSNYLKSCLDHICSQLTDEVQVIVRDNCSNNYDFDTFIEPYVTQFGVKPVKNNINVGGDANVAKIFETCDTKWLWVIGDDDYISEGVVSKVLSVLKNNPEAIYIKFNSVYQGESFGLDGFAKAMTPETAFAYSFFTSECLNNIDKTKDYIYWHYLSLSTRCPQIIRVMKYLEDNKDGQCLFLKDEILETHGGDNTWNKIDIVPYQSIIFDYFRKNKSVLNDNVFREIARYCLVFIDSADISWSDKWYYYKLIIVKYGLLNILRYNYIQVFRIPARHIFSKKLYNNIKKIFSR